MTRKHYIEIASILNDYRRSNIKGYATEGIDIVMSTAFENMILDFCTMFKTDNRHFDKQKFIDAVNKS